MFERLTRLRYSLRLGGLPILPPAVDSNKRSCYPPNCRYELTHPRKLRLSERSSGEIQGDSETSMLQQTSQDHMASWALSLFNAAFQFTGKSRSKAPLFALFQTTKR